MPRARLLLLITLAETGGAQKYVASLLPALAEELDVTVAAHGDGYLRDAALASGVRFVGLRHMQRAIDPRADLLGLVELVRLIRRLRPDILHANSSKAGVLGRLAAVLTGVPLRVFTVHGWAFKAHEGLLSTGYLWADRLMSPLTTRTICVSDGERAAGLAARTCRARATVVIRNGVELAPLPRAHADSRGPAQVLGVGRLRAPKDFLTLVRAVGSLPPGTVHVRIAGDGPDRPALEAEIDRLGLDGAVELLGDRDDVDDLYAHADLFVLPSLSEGLPMSALEAMAAGLPVVASSVGGVPELVKDGHTGTLVPPADPAALAAAIARLADDQRARARLGEAGRRLVAREFSLEACRRAHLELYRAMLSRARR